MYDRDKFLEDNPELVAYADLVDMRPTSEKPEGWGE